MPCCEGATGRSPAEALQKPCCTKPRAVGSAMEIWPQRLPRWFLLDVAEVESVDCRQRTIASSSAAPDANMRCLAPDR